MSPGAKTISATPHVENLKSKRPSADDDGVPRHVTPPEYYPFNDLDQVVENANNKLRVPNSIRY
jgi:hypothetical protein